MNEFLLTQLIIYKVNEEGGLQFETSMNLLEMPIFDKACLSFFFKNQEGPERDTLIFAKIDKIFELNFVTKETKLLYEFRVPLLR